MPALLLPERSVHSAVATHSHPSEGLVDQLSAVLWHERELLETLRYRLEVEQLLLEAGMTDRLPLATRDIELVLQQMRSAELGRALESQALALDLGLDPETPLAALAAAVTAPWDELLAEHHAAFVALTGEIAALSRHHHDTLTAHHLATQETLASLRDTVQTYDRHGTRTRHAEDGQIVDESF